MPRVEAGKKTSTVIPESRKRLWKGNPVVSDETVIYGYESSEDHSQIALQITDPYSRQRGRPKTKSKSNFPEKRKEKVKVFFNFYFHVCNKNKHKLETA
jgi:hypothetical protein